MSSYVKIAPKLSPKRQLVPNHKKSIGILGILGDMLFLWDFWGWIKLAPISSPNAKISSPTIRKALGFWEHVIHMGLLGINKVSTNFIPKC
jgi:hypothetical protein